MSSTMLFPVNPISRMRQSTTVALNRQSQNCRPEPPTPQKDNCQHQLSEQLCRMLHMFPLQTKVLVMLGLWLALQCLCLSL